MDNTPTTVGDDAGCRVVMSALTVQPSDEDRKNGRFEIPPNRWKHQARPSPEVCAAHVRSVRQWSETEMRRGWLRCNVADFQHSGISSYGSAADVRLTRSPDVANEGLPALLTTEHWVPNRRPARSRDQQYAQGRTRRRCNTCSSERTRDGAGYDFEVVHATMLAVGFEAR
ncbi:hypothetical protein D9611_003584 [Ephemerocybe angulata]|uniref:Uncharacterized protein n=1 Tax=Ephemerocybe angulata TaxID=980116 RepID=A0A8H5B5H7_9AGAR|nr:hypothetical protein D9611_003584 [Tulosesus angulatus]